MHKLWRVYNQMMETFEEIHSCVALAFQNTSAPKRYLPQLVQLYELNPPEFSKAFQNIFLQLAPNFRKDPQAERGLKFLFSVLAELKRKCCEEKPEIPQLFTNVLKLLISGCEAREKSQRFASVWLLDRILTLNIQEIPLPSLIFHRITSTVKDLLKDKHSNIRFHGASIARKCEMSSELIKALQKEPIKDIRKYMISLASGDKNSCKAIGKRLKDSEPSVRLAACKKLQEVSDFTYCKEVLVMSVIDRSKEVREAAGVLLRNFIKESGLMKISEILDLKHSDMKRQNEIFKGFQYVCETVATQDQICEVIGKNICTASELSMEGLLLLRICVETLREVHENLLYSLLPELSVLQIGYTHLDFPLFYSQNILKISLCADIGEEYTRLALTNQLKTLCTTYPLGLSKAKDSQQITENYSKLSHADYFPTKEQDVFSQIMSCLRCLFKDQETEFCRSVIEIINDIRDPLFEREIGESLTEIKKGLSERLERLLQDIQGIDCEIQRIGEFNMNREIISRKQELDLEVENVSSELENVQNQILTILQRSLVLSCELLRYTKHGVMDAEMTEIVQTLIYPSLQLNDKAVNTLAIECLGLFCISHAAACKEYLYIFKVILQKKENGVLEFIALKSVLDFYMVFEFSEATESDFNVSGNSMLEIVIGYIDSPNTFIKAMVIEGLCKLLLLERNTRADVLAKLLLAFFDSSSSDMVKQILHVFFTHYPLVSEVNAANLADGFMLSLGLVCGNINKNYSGLDLTRINVNKIFSFVFMYLNPEYIKLHGKFQSTFNLHFHMFHLLCSEVLRYPEKSQAKIYPRMLIQLNFASFTTKELSIAHKLLGKIRKIVKEKVCANAVAKTIEGIIKINDRVDGNYEDLEGIMNEKYEKISGKMKKFLKAYQETTFNLKESDFDDPIEFSDEFALKRSGSPVNGSAKKIKKIE